ncbi:DUF58 domain-containing protein [Galbitalea sp. SE-J8]|uniref:DUF58 domain-containing protein n=1 Tax=Galbitalea sp. SE-J8 TaxID=3054952 RepID=UPI00259D13B6|nr:DUF58 domain-containing protein [Galbitalea sp. SE-J8]MDM4763479.1 DUF58 domain-containing protein [Galbitalea sp. SE-J8]
MTTPGSPTTPGRPAPGSPTTRRSPRATGTQSTGGTGGTTVRDTLAITGSRSRLAGERGVAADAVVGLGRVARTVRAVLARTLRRVAEIVTPLGWSVLGAIPVGLVVGYAFGWAEFLTIGWASVALVAIAVMYLATGSVDSIALSVPRNRIVAGESTTGTVRAANARRRRALGIIVEVPVGDGLARIPLPPLARGEVAERAFAVPTARRGVLTVGPARTVNADPIGLVRRELVFSGMTELFVHPRTVSLAGVAGGLTPDLEGQAQRELTASDLAFHAVREYLPGDERRHIHWRSTAKTGRYMVRQFEQTRRSSLVIALALDEGGYASDAEFELAVSVAASIGARAVRTTRDVAFVVSADAPTRVRADAPVIRSLSTVTPARLLDDLARVDRAVDRADLPTVARVAAAATRGASVAFLVCGSAVSASAVRRSAARFDPGVRVVALIVDPDAAPEYSRTRALAVARLGALDDVRGAIERVLG